MDKKTDCPTCDGTGEVHSHNPRCWTCNGTGKIAVKEAEREMEMDRKRRGTVEVADGGSLDDEQIQQLREQMGWKVDKGMRGDIDAAKERVRHLEGQLFEKLVEAAEHLGVIQKRPVEGSVWGHAEGMDSPDQVQTHPAEKSPSEGTAGDPDHVQRVVDWPGSWPWFNMGTSVRLRSGGPVMTVAAVEDASEGLLEVVWFDGHEYKRDYLEAICLVREP